MIDDRTCFVLFCKSCRYITLHKVAGFNPATSSGWAYCLERQCGAAQHIKLDNVQIKTEGKQQ